MWVLDGTLGCGGGHVLRTALALSVATGTPLRVLRARLDREPAGLMRQHLSAVEAAAKVCEGQVEGATLGSQDLVFRPGPIQAGEHTLRVGLSRSVWHLAELVLPALSRASEPSVLTLEGGTCTPDGPPSSFWARGVLPLWSQLGTHFKAREESVGFSPAAGGRVVVHVTPQAPLDEAWELMQRGEVRRKLARVLVGHLPMEIADREVEVLDKLLTWGKESFRVEPTPNARGPGNAVLLEVEAERVTEVFWSVGAKGVKAEQVAEHPAHAARRWLGGEAAVGRDLAERLIVPLALHPGGGRFTTLPPSQRLQTSCELVQRLLGVPCRLEDQGNKAWLVEVGPPARR